MSLMTGKSWSWGFRFDAFKEIPSTGTPVDDVMLGALDAPGCIAAGSAVPDPCLANVAASMAIVRSTGKQTTVSVIDLL